MYFLELLLVTYICIVYVTFPFVYFAFYTNKQNEVNVILKINIEPLEIREEYNFVHV